MNRILGLGNLVRDVELRYREDGTAIAKFTVALRREIKNKEGKYDSDFVNCVAFQKLAETIKNYFQKGSRILFEGRIQTGSYQNTKGERIYTTDVVVEKINFVDKLEQKETPIENQRPEQVIASVVNNEDPYAAFGKQVEMDNEGLPF